MRRLGYAFAPEVLKMKGVSQSSINSEEACDVYMAFGILCCFALDRLNPLLIARKHATLTIWFLGPLQ